MATWLSLAVLAVTVTSLIVASLISVTTGNEVTGEVTDDQLSGRAALKADQVEQYLTSIRNRTVELATGTELVAAAERFIDAFDQLGVTIAEAPLPTEDVARAYRDDFVPALEAAFGVPIGWQNLVPQADPAIYLQSHYVVLPELQAAERRLIDDARDGSAWSEVHASLHPRFLDITERLELQDLAIVEPNRGAIVYSTAKGLDFATSLDTGPHSGSTMAALVRRVRDDPIPAVAAFADFAPTTAHEGHPVGFVAAPLMDGDRLVATLVLQIPPTELDAIMTGEGRLDEGGLGATGEAYLVAQNGRMRSNARAFLEDPVQYLADVAAAGSATQTERTAMEGLATTVVFQQAVAGDDLDAAFSGRRQSIDRTNYLGRGVTTAAAPVEFEGLQWAVISEITTAELDQPVVDFQRNVLIAVAIFVILVSFGTVAWASRVFEPLRLLSDRLRRIHDGDESPGVAVRASGSYEFAQLASSVDATIDSLQEREAALEAAVTQRLDTVRSLLPDAVAQRVEAGDRQVLDQIPQAGIAVLVVDGLGQASRNLNVEEHRAMVERVVEELDELAVHHGLERVKIVGDTYFAGCGLTEPYLDHAPRAVRFALDARLALSELRAGSDYELSLAGGVHLGPVTTGLAGSTRLVYDLWGDTVATAHQLARAAPRGAILVSAAVEARLPDDVEVAQYDADAEVWEIVGYQPVAEVSS